MIKVGVVGGTGYTGAELLRLLLQHPQVSLEVITSRGEAGTAVAALFPSLRGHLDLCFTEPNNLALQRCDLIFFATPNGIAMDRAPALLAKGIRVIDLAADFRLQDPAAWQHWYGTPHSCVQWLQQAVYGLPELNREKIQTAQLVANPGCYPTAVTLGFLPLIEKQLVDLKHLIADAKSGVSGAGRHAKVEMLYCEVNDNFRAYGVAGHRHLPEITQNLITIASNKDVSLTFVPHLTPMNRGIHATLYAKLTAEVNLQQLYEQRYQGEQFVDVLPADSYPETRTVKGSNLCRIAIYRPQNKDTVVILSVIDNLVKGAAGQAIQNMNIMWGLPENMGLQAIPQLP